MGMPITVEIAEPFARQEDLNQVFAYFRQIDEKFSPFKAGSEVSRINRGEISEADYSSEMKIIFSLAKETKQVTDGYFDIRQPDGKINPSGIVKGWAIWQAAQILKSSGINNFYLNAGGDIEAVGRNKSGQLWTIGLQNPFQPKEIIKVVYLADRGIATSGTYLRGRHIYNPHRPNDPLNDIISLTVIGPNVYEADRFATAAFAMGAAGISLIENQPELEGYLIDKDGTATMTSKFEDYTIKLPSNA